MNYKKLHCVKMVNYRLWLQASNIVVINFAVYAMLIILVIIVFLSDQIYSGYLTLLSIYQFLIFGPRVYPRGSLVIPLSVRPSVGPSLNISETVHQFFLIFCMKLVHRTPGRNESFLSNAVDTECSKPWDCDIPDYSSCLC